MHNPLQWNPEDNGCSKRLDKWYYSNTVITGSSMFSNPLGLIPFKKIGLYDSIIGIFDFDLSNSSFESLDLKSDSTIFNSFSFFIFFGLFIFLHFLIIMLYKIVNKWNSNESWKWKIPILGSVLKSVLLILTYGYYIRFVLQTNQYLLVSSMHEIYTMDTTDSLKIISFVFAWLVLLACLSLLGFVVYLSLSSYEAKDKEHNKIGEFFTGVKMQKKTKFYSSLLIFRRTIFVIFLIGLASISSKTLISILRVI